MSKPAVVMFVGVESLSPEDESKLPEDVRRVYQQGFDDEDTESGGDTTELHFEVTVAGLEIEYITGGCSETADPGSTIGFGVIFYDEWYDSGTTPCNPQEIAMKAAQAHEGLEGLFKQWGLEAKPSSLTACIWQ